MELASLAAKLKHPWISHTKRKLNRNQKYNCTQDSRGQFEGQVKNQIESQVQRYSRWISWVWIQCQSEPQFELGSIWGSCQWSIGESIWRSIGKSIKPLLASSLPLRLLMEINERLKSLVAEEAHGAPAHNYRHSKRHDRRRGKMCLTDSRNDKGPVEPRISSMFNFVMIFN